MRIEKSDAVAYYKAIARTILPHLRYRPLSFKRFPGEIGGEFFWEKDAPGFTPQWVKRFPVPRREGGPPIDYVVCNNMRTLTWLAGIGGIELHPFLHMVPKIDVATHAVFDLDPGQDVTWAQVISAARDLRDMLTAVLLGTAAPIVVAPAISRRGTGSLKRSRRMAGSGRGPAATQRRCTPPSASRSLRLQWQGKARPASSSRSSAAW